MGQTGLNIFRSELLALLLPQNHLEKKLNSADTNMQKGESEHVLPAPAKLLPHPAEQPGLPGRGVLPKPRTTFLPHPASPSPLL